MPGPAISQLERTGGHSHSTDLNNAMDGETKYGDGPPGSASPPQLPSRPPLAPPADNDALTLDDPDDALTSSAPSSSRRRLPGSQGCRQRIRFDVVSVIQAGARYLDPVRQPSVVNGRW